jgi:hypothetical protein
MEMEKFVTIMAACLAPTGNVYEQVLEYARARGVPLVTVSLKCDEERMRQDYVARSAGGKGDEIG